MRIYRRGKVYWLQWRDRRISLHVTDRQAAELAAKEYQRRAVDPAYTPKDTVTLLTACEAYIRDRGHRAEGTREMIGHHVGHFQRIIGEGLEVGAIDSALVDAYIATRRRDEIVVGGRTVSSATIAKELSTLRGLLRLAARRGWFSRPLEQVLPPPIATNYQPLTRALTESQIPTFLAAFTDWGHAAICCYLIGLGADWCAVARARAEDFTSDGSSVLIKGTKTPHRWAHVPIVPPFVELVARAHHYLQAHGSFPQWANACRSMALVASKTGLPRVTPRDLRRTHGRILRARGVPPHLIGRMLRHSDSRMAELVYGGLEPGDLGRLVADVVQPDTNRH